MAENELIGLFDTHAHPTDERFDEDRTEVLARMRQADMLSHVRRRGYGVKRTERGAGQRKRKHLCGGWRTSA